MSEHLLRGAFTQVGLRMRWRGHWWLAPSARECDLWAREWVYDPVGAGRSTLCFRSGYHSNWYRDGVPNSEEEDKWFREQNAKSFFGAVMGKILRERRWWWQHPRWHLLHWVRKRDWSKAVDLVNGAPFKYRGLPVPQWGIRIQVHPVQHFKRWAFSKCSKCGKGFRWGYAPCGNSWSGTGPRWFRREKDVFHSDCDRPESECVASVDFMACK